jgi:TP901 family phage tail tape measure protein
MAANTILIALQVNMRGATKVDELNRSLLTLRKTVAGLAKGLGGSNSAITSATNAIKNTTKAYDQSARAAQQNAKVAQQAARQREAAERNIAKVTANTNRVMAAQFRQLQEQRRKEHEATARIIARTDQNMARQFAVLQRQQAQAQAKAVNQKLKEQQAHQRGIIALQRQQNQQLQRAGELLDHYSMEMKTIGGRMRAVQPFFDAIFRAGYRMQEVGRDMMQIGERGIGLIKDLANEFGQFEFMINRAAGAMGMTNIAGEEGAAIYERFKTRILETSRELRLFAATDVAKAAYFWASATGQQVDSLTDLEAVLKSVTPLMKIAAMTQTDYETAIKGVYSISIQYGLKMTDIQRITEKLHQVTQRTAAEFPDLINSFKMVGPVAAANSVTFEDVANVLGRLADAGIRGTMAGRGLRQFFIQTVRPSAIAKKALDDLWASTPAFMGKTFDEMIFPGGKFGGMDQYIHLLAKALKDATEAQRNFYLARITTANELPIVTALVAKEIGVMKGYTEGWDKSKEATADAAASFQKSWDLLANSWLGVVGAFERGIESIRIVIGGRIANVLKPIIEQFTAFFEVIIDWVENPRNGDVIDFFIKAAAAISVFLAAGGGLMLMAGSLTNLGAAIAVVAHVFGPLILKFTGFGAAVGIVAGALIKNFDYIKEAAQDVIANLQEAFGGKGRGIDAISESLQFFARVIAPVFDIIIQRSADAVVALSELIKLLMQFGPTAFIIEKLAAGVAVLFGLRMIKSILGFGGALGVVTKAFAGLAVASRGAAISGVGQQLIGGGAAISKTTRAVEGLKGAFGRLKGVVSGNWIMLIGIAFLTVYETVPEVQQVVDSLFDSIIDNAPAAKAELDELLASFSQGPAVESMLKGTPVFAELQRQTEVALARYKDTQKQFNAPWDLLGAQQAFERAERAQTGYIKNFVDSVQRTVDGYTAGGFTVTLDQFYAKLFDVQRTTGASPEKALQITRQYFAAQNKIVADATAEAQVLLDKFNSGTGAGETPTGWMAGKKYENYLLAQMVGMKDRVTPQMAELIEMALTEAGTTGAELGVDGAIEGFEGEAPKLWKGIGESIISGAKELTNLKDRIKEAIKTAISPRAQTAALTEAIVSWTTKGFKNAKGRFIPEAVAVAQGAVQDWTSQMTFYSETMPAPKFEKMAQKAIDKLIADFGPIWGQLPPGLRTEIDAAMASVYALLPEKTVPQDVLDRLHGKGEAAGEEVPAGVRDGVNNGLPAAQTTTSNAISAIERTVKFGKTPYNEGASIPTDVKSGINSTKGQATKAATDTKNKINKNLDPGSTPHNQGKKVPTNFAKGMNRMRGNVVTAASNLAAATKGAGKYAKSAWNWGNSLATNLWRGMLNQIQNVQNTARRLAGVIAGPLEHSVPKEGPLSTDDEWGGHLVQNIIDGMHKSLPALKRESLEVARTLQVMQTEAAQSGVTFENNTRRTIKVQIEVTSPDGSVDRVKASQLQQSLATSDLILAIEHMSTVG